ncbi:putative membrane protein [Thermonema lapsum]|uniref:Putative membrane protein n=1 Tax=Thermonema lapsum TaxID=28195 RepID=A0A846MPB8_9BACT|nr:hypothetical protein [Thermonema lapsum]NIK73428.1 putative membrane protein [Thermonema lapsum]
MSELKELLKDYLLLRYEQGKLDIEERIDKVAHSLVSLLFISSLLSSALLFISLGIAFWINARLHSDFLGFLIVGGMSLLLLLLFFFFRTKFPFYQRLVDKVKENIHVS